MDADDIASYIQQNLSSTETKLDLFWEGCWKKDLKLEKLLTEYQKTETWNTKCSIKWCNISKAQIQDFTPVKIGNQYQGSTILV